MSSDTIEFYFYSTISLSCLYLIVITQYKYFMAKNWEQVLANIIQINVLKEAQGRYLSGGKDKEVKSLNIQYTYTTSNKTYKGNKVSLIDDLPIFSNFKPETYAVLNKLSINNSKLPIYVSSKNKKNSLIDRELNISKITNLLIVSVVFFLLSLNKLNTSDSFLLHSYLAYLILLAPIIIIERFAFKKNQSFEVNSNK